MKKLKTIIPLTLIVIAVFVYIYQQNHIDTDAQRAQRIKEIKEADKIQNAKKKKFQEKIRKLEKAKGRKLTDEEMIAALPKKSQNYYRLALKGNMHMITFFGKVIDQYGEPVAGAELKVGAGGSFISGGKDWWLTVDDQGLFNVEVEGSSFGIDTAKHPKAEFKQPLDENGRKISFRFGFAEYDRFKWFDYNTPDKAFVVKMWRTEQPEKLMHGRKSLVMEPDERTYTITFYDHYVKHGRNYVKTISKEGKHPGHLHVRAYVDPIPEGISYTDVKAHWWFELEAVGGGLIEAVGDAYLNLAPETGYQQKIRVGAFANGRKGPREARDKRYYFNTDNGQGYGSLIIEFAGVSGRKDNKPVFIIKKFKFNPNASRNLALPPNIEIYY